MTFGAPEPIEPQQTEPEAASSGTPEAEEYKVHPSWEQVIAPMPDLYREPIVEQIRRSEREAQAAIEKARAGAVGDDWRALADAAKQQGVGPQDLAGAWRGQQELANLLRTDPDGFVEQLNDQIDQLVSEGVITRREGAQMKREGAAVAGEQTEALLTAEQRELAELKQWREQMESREQQRAAAERQAYEAAQYEQQMAADVRTFADEFNRQMVSTGLARQDESGKLEALVPGGTIQLIADIAASLYERDESLTHEAAVTRALSQVKSQIEATGGRLAPQPTSPLPPVAGAGGGYAPGQAAPAAPSGRDEAAQAMLAELARLQGTITQ